MFKVFICTEVEWYSKFRPRTVSYDVSVKSQNCDCACTNERIRLSDIHIVI